MYELYNLKLPMNEFGLQIRANGIPEKKNRTREKPIGWKE